MSRLIIALALMAWVSSTAQADNVYTLDFDATPVAGQTTTGGASTGVNFMNSDGVGGTNGAVISFDSGGFSTGLFADIDLFNNPGFLQQTPTSTSLSDYFLSFDILATGFAPGVTSFTGTTQASFDVGNFGATNTFLSNVPFGASVTDQFTTITIPLGTGTVNPADFLTTDNADRPRFTLSLLGVDNGQFGEDTDNTFVLDNITLVEVSAVPEPGSFLLVAIGITGLATRRRRSC